MITDILHHEGTDPKERKEIEIEQEAWRTVNAMFEERERRYQKELAEKDKLIEELKRQLSERKK